MVRRLVLFVFLLAATPILATAQERSWILWAQPINSSGRLAALVATSSQAACERKRADQVRKVGADWPYVYTCLPDTTVPPCQ